jgi:hypothetical protein
LGSNLFGLANSLLVRDGFGSNVFFHVQLSAFACRKHCPRHEYV